MRFFFKKISQRRIRSRLFLERLTEPVHLNLLSLLVAVFGSYRQKITFDLILRPQNAHSLLRGAANAKRFRRKKLTVVELGVASGAGLINISHIARRITKITGIGFEIFGFDTGTGMPQARDYRDHPELYWEGNYPMDPQRLTGRLPDNTQLILGDITTTLPGFLEQLRPDAPLAFVSLDLDYYWSTREALKIFEAAPDCYLPETIVYVDDINLPSHNSWCGARLAINEFNEQHRYRKIERDDFLVHSRVFKNAMWISQIFKLHVLDHPVRSTISRPDYSLGIPNPYL
jgi:hypothetical protein